MGWVKLKADTRFQFQPGVFSYLNFKTVVQEHCKAFWDHISQSRSPIMDENF